MRATDRGNRIDRATQFWVRATGRRVSFERDPWLLGPMGELQIIADDWVKREAERRNAAVVDGVGLLGDIKLLGGDTFDALDLAEPVVSFYENTTIWNMEVSHRWFLIAWPVGWLISKLFTQRLQQLNFPITSSDRAHPIESKVLSLLANDGQEVGVAWMRTMPSTGQYVYSGWYGIATLPSSDRPHLRVVFPLPNGSLIVFLRPETGPSGGLVLVSPLGEFGDPGAYLVVAGPDEKSGWARRVPIAERFDIGATGESELYTDHSIRLWRVPIIRFSYRLRPNGRAT